MKKLYYYFVSAILFSIVVYGISQDIPALVTVNPVSGILNVSPSNLVINALPLSLVEKNLAFYQELGNETLNVTLFLEVGAISSWLSFSQNNFIIDFSTKDIITFIDVPNVTAGLYSGNIHAITNKSQDLVIPVDITVTDKYKISVKIDALEKKVKPGNDVSVLTEITKTKQRRKDPEIEGKITVDLFYNLLKGKESITTLTTTIEIIDFNEKTVLIPIQLNATKGKYTVEVTATHLDKTITGKDNFQVTTNLVGNILNFFRSLI